MTSNLDDKPASDNFYENNGAISYATAMEQFGRLKTPEAVTIYTASPSSGVAVVAGRPSVGLTGLGTDANFWKVFDFTFISGKPYTQADFESAALWRCLAHPRRAAYSGRRMLSGRRSHSTIAPTVWPGW